MKDENATHTALKWIARVWSLASLLFVLAFVVGELVNPSGRPPNLREWVALAFWPLGVLVGLLVAWRREALGGLVAAGCLAAFYLWYLILGRTFPRGPWFVLVAAPGLLFLLAWLTRRRNPGTTAPRGPRADPRPLSSVRGG